VVNRALPSLEQQQIAKAISQFSHWKKKLLPYNLVAFPLQQVTRFPFFSSIQQGGEKGGGGIETLLFQGGKKKE
jgi:hypothetical protein